MIILPVQAGGLWLTLFSDKREVPGSKDHKGWVNNEDGNPANIPLTNRWNSNPAISDRGTFPFDVLVE